MNITSMSNGELYKTLSGREANVRRLTDDPRMKDRIVSVYPSERDTFVRGEDNLDGSSVTNLFESAFPMKVLRMSNNELAEHLGGIGKRLDEAYAQGKFTEDEYDELCKGLDEYSEHLTAQTERMRAVWAIGKERGETRLANLKMGIPFPEPDTRPVEEKAADFKAEVDSYVENVTKIDRRMISEMIRQVRYGVLNILPKK